MKDTAVQLGRETEIRKIKVEIRIETGNRNTLIREQRSRFCAYLRL